jgi:hypothetical protein
MKKILSCNASIESAMLLRSILEEATGKHFLVSKEAGNITNEGVLVRYGNGFPIAPGYPDTKFNPPPFIEMCVHKAMTSQTLQNLGILTPVFYENGLPNRYPVLVRATLTGNGGEGITPVENEEEFGNVFRRGMVWTPYIESKYEVRAYVAGGNITHTYYKTPFENQEGDGIRIRSEYHFSYTNPMGRFSKLRKIIGQIVDATNGAFFSVDAGWIPESNDYIIYELNSGSWMNKSIARSLVSFLTVNLAADLTD